MLSVNRPELGMWSISFDQIKMVPLDQPDQINKNYEEEH